MTLITLLTGGCVGDRADYLGGFPPLAAVEPGECPDISGQYSNIGQHSHEPEGQLSFILWHGEEEKSHYEADRLVVTQPAPRTIEVVAPLEGAHSVRHGLSRDDDDYSCDNEMVVISSAKDYYTGAATIVAGYWKEWRFARTIEGSLAVEHVSKDFGLLILVPLGFAESFWIQVPAVSEAAIKSPSPAP